MDGDNLKSYKELIVWQKAYKLTIDIYKITEKFPQREQFGLSSQMRRCVVSIVSNIAEGCQRQFTREYVQFLSIAFGSCSELETQLMIARDLKFLTEEEFKQPASLLDEIGKMLNVLMQRLKLTTSH